jgi:SAM-dependent methyltransferase
MGDPTDRFGGGDYRHLIDWGPRMRREAPFLRRALGAPDGRCVADLGCGTGEHARWLAAEGWTALGVDPSPSQIARAKDYEGESGARGPFFHAAAMEELPGLVDSPLAGALCVGNVLPSLEDEALARSLQAVAASLRPGAPLVVQLLNYARIRRQGLRCLPVNVRPDPEEAGAELVWVRLLSEDDDDHLLFHPVTLQLRRGADEPVRLRSAREIRVRAWTWPALEPLLRRAGFSRFARWGSVEEDPFEEDHSPDLVFTAVRAG